MDNIDEILNHTNLSTTITLDKDQWIKNQQEKRERAYKMIEKTLESLLVNEKKFQTYLDVLSKFNRYSVGNCLLITAQKPEATLLKSFTDWKKYGTIYRNHQKIILLEPGKEYVKNDGTSSVYYNPKELIDISDTSVKYQDRKVFNDNTLKLTALVSDCPISIQVVQKIKNANKLVEWDSNNETLYVQRTSDVVSVFQELSQELASVGFKNRGDRALNDFKSKCVSYVVCKKNEMDIPFDIKIPTSIKKMNSKEIREELEDMKSSLDEIVNRMDCFYEKYEKQKSRNDVNMER